jgi:DNA-binding NarL/FixJ family response regulator
MSIIKTVLIEDHELTRIGLRTGLKRRSEIEYLGDTENAKEGLKLIEKTNPHVAIVDIGLPEIDGIELTKKLQAIQQENKKITTKILILTLQDNQDSVLAAFAAGADSYCMKNISFDLLIEAIKTTKEGNSWIDPAIAKIVLSQAKKINLNNQKIPPQLEENKETILTYPLTERELEVLQLIVNGYSNASIAEELFITVGTVKTHVRNILNKLSVDDRTQAAVRALREGLVG